MIDQRIHKRYTVFDGPILLDSSHIGKIENISDGGLLCLCLLSEEHQKADNLSISCPSNDFHMENIPFNTIRTMVKRDTFGHLCYRQCGIKFGELNPGQWRMLQYFMENYTY